MPYAWRGVLTPLGGVGAQRTIHDLSFSLTVPNRERVYYSAAVAGAAIKEIPEPRSLNKDRDERPISPMRGDASSFYIFAVFVRSGAGLH